MARIYSRAYLLTKVLTATNREVVLYLYEGALGFLNRAIQAREKSDASTAGEAIDKVVSILIELSCCLDYNRNGELALRLDSIYNYMIEALSLSNAKQDTEALHTCEGILTILGDAWRQAVNSEKSPEQAPVAELRLSA